MGNNLFVNEPGKWTGTWYKVIQPIPCLVEAIGKDGDPTWGRLILRPGMHVIAMPAVFVCPDGKIAFPAEYDGNDPDFWPKARLQRCAPLPQKIDFREFGNGFMKEEAMIKEDIEQTNLQPKGKYGNFYYMVTEPFYCYIRTGHKPSNAYYGSSRIYEPIWKRITLDEGNIVMSLAGGVYVSTDNRQAYPAHFTKPEFSPFTRAYGRLSDDWPLENLSPIPPPKFKFTYINEEVEQLAEQVTYVTGKEPEVQAIVRAAFPDYRGNRYKINVTDQPVNIASYWEGGSRDYYVIVRLDSLKVADVPQQSAFDRPLPAQFKDMKIPDGIAIVQHSIVLGKDMGITIHIAPSNASKLLGSGKKDDLTRNEKIVLIATRSLKSSYGGIKEYRYHEAARSTGITKPEWDAAKASLTKKRMLNSAGAITVEGRNAIGQAQFYSLKEGVEDYEKYAKQQGWTLDRQAGRNTLHYKDKKGLTHIYHIDLKLWREPGESLADAQTRIKWDKKKMNEDANPVLKHPKLHFWLVSAVTEYDRQQEKKPGHSIYALSHYLAAVEGIEEDLKDGWSLKTAISNNFSGRLETFIKKWVEKQDKKLLEETEVTTEVTLPQTFGQWLKK